MKISLIICTYMRPIPVATLLRSVIGQSCVPDEVLIVDASNNNLTQLAIEPFNDTLPLKYFKVPDEYKGLTRQRNYGVARVNKEMDIVAFLDDDTVLCPDYFERLIAPYSSAEIVGVGGYIIDEVENNGWQKEEDAIKRINYFYCDGWKKREASRIILRKRLGLLSNYPPGVMPPQGNGRSVSGFPPTGKIYPVEYFMGGAASYRKSLFERVRFSPYFEGYGLYEDLDFCLRALPYGKLRIHTGAQLYHYHDSNGRPNQYKYGKMVIRNGYYVWRIKYPKVSFESWWKFYAIAWLQTGIRVTNVMGSSKRWEALTESTGRVVGLFSLMFNQPKRVD